jgi:hypothetical protein
LRLEPLEDRWLLATITVTTPQDTVDFNDGVTSLREAIFVANTVTGPDTIEFDFGHDGPATILLRHGELKITDDLTIHGQGAELLTIDASGNDPTPDTHNHDGSRVFNIDDGRSGPRAPLPVPHRDRERGFGIPVPNGQLNVMLTGLTLTGGDVLGLGGAILNRENLTLRDSIITGNSAHGGFDGGGGGINSGDGQLNIVGTTISENYSSSSGGGVESSGRVTITHSILRENGSFLPGGGINVIRGEATIKSTIISGNRGRFGGGGIDIARGATTVINSSLITQNESGGISSGHGAGVLNDGMLTLIDSTVSENRGSKGAGIFNGSRAIVSNSTISGNVSAGGGGGIYNFVGRVTIEFSTITNNAGPDGWGAGVATAGTAAGFRAASTEIYSTIVAGNRGSDVDFVNGDMNTFHSGGFNLIGSGSAAGEFVEPGDKAGADPRLGPLADNGGFLLPDGNRISTHALLAGSPALDAGNPSARPGIDGVPLLDQRGEPFGRVAGQRNGRIDIGALESPRPSDRDLVVDTLVDEMDEDTTPGDLSLREAIAISNQAPTNGTIRFAPTLSGGTIRLTMGELRITDDVSIDGPGPKNLTIDASGNDPTPVLNNHDGSRIFNIDGSGELDVSISGVTLTGGDVLGLGGAIFNSENLTLRESVITGNAANDGLNGGGGGIHNDSGVLIIEHSTIRDNYSQSGGGGVQSTMGRLTITHSIITENRARSGAGILLSRGEAIVSFSSVSENRALAGGGGISNSAGTLSVRSTLIDGNRVGGLSSARGAGIRNSSGTLTVIDSTISNNTGTKGVGIYNAAGDHVVTLRNSTISGNVSAGGGGGIYNSRGRLVIEFSTITGNVGPEGWGSGVATRDGETEVYSTIIAGNTGSDVDFTNGVSNMFVSRGFNLIGFGNALDAFDDRGDRARIDDPRLAPLADNGGVFLPDGRRIPTHTPRLDSPAINAGHPDARAGQQGVPRFDQRGEPFGRVLNGRIDIGAFERGMPRGLRHVLAVESESVHDQALLALVGLGETTRHDFDSLDRAFDLLTGSSFLNVQMECKL